MSPYERIEQNRDSFTKKEMIIYEIFSQNPEAILTETAVTMAHNHGVSQSTLTRFCQKIGYEGYNDFKYDVFRYEKASQKEENAGENALDCYIRLLKIMKETLDTDQMQELAKAILAARNVYVFGYHKSSLPAMLLCQNLRKFHIPAFYISNNDLVDIYNILTDKDLAIVFSNQGRALGNNLDFRDEWLTIHFKEAIITCTPGLSAQKYCDFYVCLPSARKMPTQIYLENQIVDFIYVDLLTSQLGKLLPA